MRAGRYVFAGGARAVRWPFAVHEVRVTPLIAPEFQANFQKILTTTRLYFDIEAKPRREPRKHGSAGR